jgi:perosamine synthetase
VAECLRTGWISSEGRFIELFEQQWAAYCGMHYGVAVSSGTAALEIAVETSGVQPGDEVIMPTFTIISCPMAVVRRGGVPVLVDSDSRTWCMDVSQLEAKVTPRTRAVMPVHIYGHPVDMGPVLDLARRHSLTIIEDAAEAHGAEYKGRKCGALGDLNCFSFYANKIITTGEGGMVLTDHEDHAQHLRSLRNLCFRKERRFYHTELGHNFRLTNVQAAIGLGQFERIEETVERKRRTAAAYIERLEDIGGLQLPVEESWAKNVYWMFGVVVDEATGWDATGFARELVKCGIITRPFFLGVHEQPVFREMGLFQGERYRISERLARQGLYLPSGPGLTESQIDCVCDAVREVLTRKGGRE